MARRRGIRAMDQNALTEVRRVTDPSIPIRLYPDITHSYSCQYPVPEWDLAFAMTLGRECINPRPVDEKLIHNRYASPAQGSISYSEGTNDDLNKFIWTSLDWNPATPVIETLRDYARYFLGPQYTEGVARVCFHWNRISVDPLLSNEQVERTLQQWQDMESSASAEVLSNPRFQSGLLRAYFDAYTQRRLLYETELERQARTILEGSGTNGSLKSIQDARKHADTGQRKTGGATVEKSLLCLGRLPLPQLWRPTHRPKTPCHERSRQLY